jgi:hypothetical protein
VSSYIGDSGGRGKVLANYTLFSQAPLASHAEVVNLVRVRRLHGRGIGWVDTHLLASCLVGGSL